MNPLLVVSLLLAGVRTCIADTPVPFYGETASGKTSAARGWNSFVAQSNGVPLKVSTVDQQCSFFYQNTADGFDYVCGFDSSWSVGCNGDDNGRIIPDSNVFDTMSVQDFAAKLHSNGMKLGLYMIPGAFQADENKTVAGTDFVIGDLFNRTVDGRTGISNTYNCRNDFDYSKPGVQEWHDSVVQQFASWGVDFIKLDYVTPGSSLGDSNDDSKPANDSGAVAAMHSAISRLAPNMRLDISWKLDREQPFFDLWKHNADALRVDQDINFGANPVTWNTVQRTLEQYREFINQQVLDPSRQNQPIMIRPDMDNLLVATDASASTWSGFNTIERYGQTILWLGAGAKLVVGSDMTQVDDLGRLLLTNDEVLDVASFTANWPMVPKQPADRAAQLQAWIAGPDDDGTTAVVVLSNLGPDLGQSGYSDNFPGDQLVNVTLETLGIGGSSWAVRRVLGGGGRGGEDFTDLGTADSFLASWLSEHESVLYKLTKA